MWRDAQKAVRTCMSPEGGSKQKTSNKSRQSCENVEVDDINVGEGVGATATATQRNSVKAWRAT